MGVSVIGSWWWFWLAFIFLFVLPPVGYGWGYRGWGPPLPSFVQRRRGADLSWGLGGDFVWVVALVGIAWAVSATFWGWGRW